MSEIDDLITGVQNQRVSAAANAVGQIDANPDQAAESIRLSNMTGAPASAINDNFDDYKTHVKTTLAGDIIRNSPYITDYVKSHPLAASVSNDDWGNLSQFSKGASGTSTLLKALNAPQAVTSGVLEGAAKGALEGAEEGMGPNEYPATKQYGLGWLPFEYGGKLIAAGIGGLAGGITGAVHGGAKAAALAMGSSENGAEQFAGTLAEVADYQMTKGEHHMPEGMALVEHTQAVMQAQAVKAAEPWVQQGLIPPRGVHPIIDQAFHEANVAALDRLDEDLANAQASLTKTRSPEMFQKFVEQHYGNATMSVHGDAVAAMYGDKAPAAGDGLLGFVPDIERKLEAAKVSGDDVHIPIKDWIANVDPQIAKGLHDDIRMFPQGITIREAADPLEPKPLVDSALAQVRGTSGLEPMFAVGDRKLTLVPDQVVDRSAGDINAADKHHLVDDQGQRVGFIHIYPDKEAKQLFVDNIEGLGDYGPNSFGPSLILDLKRQLKALYPDYETISGMRISGARGGENASTPVVRLSTPQGWDKIEADPLDISKTKQIFAAQKLNLHPTYKALVIPTELYTSKQHEISAAVEKELRQTLGNNFYLQPTVGFTKPGQARAGMLGAFQQLTHTMPFIMYDLHSKDPLGVARHEGIHYLRQMGMFDDKEWKILSEASEKEGWINRYGINTRYSDLDEEGQIEESVAEAYRDWARGKGTPEAQALGQTPITKVFQKLADLWEGIKSQFAKVFGADKSWEEIFQQVQQGEMVNRPIAPLDPRAWKPAFALEDDFSALKASGAQMDKKTWDRLQDLIQKRYASDMETAEKRALAQQKKEQSKEWKDNYKVISKEVEDNIRQRPDVAADLFIGSGELHGSKLRQRYPLRAEDLTDEQKKSLPRHYYSASGLPIDDVARMFGYGSGDAMVERLADYNATKGTMSAQDMLKAQVKAETDRQMELKYGSLQDNIINEAKDQAVSDVNLQILGEELHAVGLMAGQPVDRPAVQAWVKEQFAGRTLQTVDSQRALTEMARHSRDAERALIAGKPADALHSMQRKYTNALLAAESRKLEKEMVRFDKDAKRLGKRETTMLPDYHNYIRQILSQIGKKVQGTDFDIQRRIEGRTGQTLQEFVEDKAGDFREIPVMPELFDSKWQKAYETLTVAEFRGVRDSIKTLAFHGRDEMKITKAGEAEDLAEVKSSIIDHLDRWAKQTFDVKGQRVGAIKGSGLYKGLVTFGYNHLQIETIMNRLDHFDPHGPLNTTVMRGLFDGANQEDKWRKEYSKQLSAADDKMDVNKTITNPIWKHPSEGYTFEMNRGNLRTIMLNVGTESNLDKLARGYKLHPDEIMTWVHQHATKEDWTFARKVWDIFEDIKGKSDTMYRSITGGIEAESISGRDIQTKFGTIKGGYYPVIYHDEFEGTSKKLIGQNAIEQDNYVRATTPAGYTKSRTGYAAPMALDLDHLPSRIAQMLHDVAMRPAIINASKIFLDHDIRNAFKARFGPEMVDLLVPYLRSVANSANYMSKAQKMGAQLGEFVRQNLVSTLVGFNPGTLMKHTPTALVQSMGEVGPVNFLKAMKGLFSVNEATGEANWQFAMKESLELQRRIQHYEETLSGVTKSIQQIGKHESLRATVQKYASYPVAMGDLLSAVPTWMATYEKAMREDGATHGDAVALADRSVRRAHGSSSTVNRPAVMRDISPWFTSVYNFFNHIMNRQAELVWKAGETLSMVRDGDKSAAMERIPALAGLAFAYVVAPAIIEQMVAPLQSKPGESWVSKATKGLAFTLGASWVGVRDLASAVVGNFEPSVGLLSTAGKSVIDFARDLGKDHPFGKQHAQTLIKHFSILLGTMTGMAPAQVGRTAAFGYGVHTGTEHPKGWGWMRGLRYGTAKPRE